VADAEGVEASDEAVQAEIDRARERSPENPKLIAYFDSPRGRAYLRATLRRTAVVESLVDRWLAAHPEVGPLPHLEDSPGAAAEPGVMAHDHDHDHGAHDHHDHATAAQPEPQEGIPA
jgi:hypothetical protein